MISRPPRQVLLVGFTVAFALLGDQALYAVLPVYFREIGLAPIHVGLILSANRWIRLLTNHLAERMTARFSTSLLLTASVILGALITGLYANVSLFSVLLLARMTWGMCWSFLRQIGIMTAVRSSSGSDNAEVMGYFNGLFRIGSVAGLLGGGILFDLMGFDRTFLVLAFVSLIGVPLASMSQKGLSRVTKSSPWFGEHGGPNRTPGLMFCGFVLGCVGSGLVMTALGAVLQQTVGSSVSVRGFIVGVATLNGLFLGVRWMIESLSAPLLGALADRTGHHLATPVFFGIGAISLLVCGVVSSVFLLSFLIPIFFFCGTVLTAVLSAEAGKRGPRTIVRFTTAWDFGAAIGPPMIWAILEVIFLPNVVFSIGSAFFFIAAVISYKKGSHLSGNAPKTLSSK